METSHQTRNKQHGVSLAFLRAEPILQQFSLGLITADADLSITYISPTARRWTLPGDKLCNILPGVDSAATAADWQVLAARAKSSTNPLQLGAAQCATSEGRYVNVPVTLAMSTDDTSGGNPARFLVLLGPPYDTGPTASAIDSPDPLAALGRLTARIAHELNNPLDGILRYVNLALRLIDDTSPSKMTHYLTESRNGLLRMTRIIGDLLEYSRSVGATEKMSLQRVVEEAIQAVSASANMDNIVVAVNFRTTDLPSVADPRLYQVCCNLIRNAVDAMPHGGRLTITVGLTSETVILRIEDTGVGLPADNTRLFEPFYTTKKSGEGTGLGLAICKEYLASMGATIKAESGPGGGAIFSIAIPIKQLQAEYQR